MFITDKTIKIKMSNNDQKVFEKCYNVIDVIVALMKMYQCTEMMNSDTGEVITIKDFYRMKGILSGLPNMDIMYYDSSYENILE